MDATAEIVLVVGARGSTRVNGFLLDARHATFRSKWASVPIHSFSLLSRSSVGRRRLTSIHRSRWPLKQNPASGTSMTEPGGTCIMQTLNVGRRAPPLS